MEKFKFAYKTTYKSATALVADVKDGHTMYIQRELTGRFSLWYGEVVPDPRAPDKTVMWEHDCFTSQEAAIKWLETTLASHHHIRIGRKKAEARNLKIGLLRDLRKTESVKIPGVRLTSTTGNPLFVNKGQPDIMSMTPQGTQLKWSDGTVIDVAESPAMCIVQWHTATMAPMAPAAQQEPINDNAANLDGFKDVEAQSG